VGKIYLGACVTARNPGGCARILCNGCWVRLGTGHEVEYWRVTSYMVRRRMLVGVWDYEHRELREVVWE